LAGTTHLLGDRRHAQASFAQRHDISGEDPCRWT
jgi:hypothetical protein